MNSEVDSLTARAKEMRGEGGMRKESRYGFAGVAGQSPSRLVISHPPALGMGEGEEGRSRSLGTRRRNKGRATLPSTLASYIRSVADRE